MKSVRGNDGSYTLLVSFELGTNPDINTVNVNNRVQVALSKLPADVRTQGVTVQEEILRPARRHRLYSPNSTHDPLFICNYATINLSIRSAARPASATRNLFGPQDYAMRAWLQTDRLTGLGLDRRRRHLGDPVAERAGARWAASARGRSPTTSSSSSTSRPRGGCPRSRSSRTSSSAPTRTARCCG